MAATLPAESSFGTMPLRAHVGRTIRLALPVMAARSGLLLMVTVDTIMAGRAGPGQLAFYAVSLAPQVLLLLTGTGLMMGTVVLTAQADGAGRPEACGRIWRLGLINAVVLGLLLGLPMLAGEAVLRLLGQSHELAAGGGAVLAQFSWGLPGLLLFTATGFFLEGIGRPGPGMVVMILANLLNVVLNALLMFGPFESGAVGAAIGTSLARWFMAAALIVYVLLVMPDARRYGVRASMRGYRGRALTLVRLGLPLSLSFLAEHAAFATVATFAGWMGAVPVAAYQICLNTMALVYMLGVGTATAASVRVGNAVGRGDRAGVAVAGWVALAFGLVVALGFVPVFLGLPKTLAGVYTADPLVLAVAAPGMTIAALCLLGDAAQGILIGALRGAADIWVPLALQLASFWLLAVPLAYCLGHGLGWGVPGLILGLLAGLTAAALLLAVRFRVLSARAVRAV